MLENILSEINESLKIIANSVKEKQEIKVIAPTNPVGQAVNNAVPQPVPMPNAIPTTVPQPTKTVSNIPQPIPTAKRSFAKEELARAMSDAVSAGKMNTIMSILGQFNVQTFAEIDPKDYNRLASMLTEAGVKI